MWNRFALGTYAPGSTFKPMMACAALEEGAINEDSVFRCTGTFHYYDLTLRCLDQTAHGSENVRLALRIPATFSSTTALMSLVLQNQ